MSPSAGWGVCAWLTCVISELIGTACASTPSAVVDAGSAVDGLAPDGEAPVACGDRTCPPGTVCCAPACGGCGPPEGCASVLCGPTCARFDARGEGTCTSILGYAWGDGGCEPVAGCSCVGSDCAALHPSPLSCHRAARGCATGGCGGFGGVPCASDADYCDFAIEGPDLSGRCFPRPTSCAGASAVPVCSRLGEFASACEAHAAGVDPATLGSCATPLRVRYGSSRLGCAEGTSVGWTLILTSEDEACTGPYAANVRLELDAVPPAGAALPARLVIAPPGSVGDGTAAHCSWSCTPLVGVVTITSFVSEGEATLDLDLGPPDGSASFVEAGVRITNACPDTAPCR